VWRITSTQSELGLLFAALICHEFRHCCGWAPGELYIRQTTNAGDTGVMGHIDCSIDDGKEALHIQIHY
jgi:hypothetical protein